jgi:hypothetical protein
LADSATTPASGSLFPVGTTSVTCSAQDVAGNVGVAVFPVTVAYGWSGFLQPINNDGTSIFKLGSTVPVKFRLTGAAAGVTDAVAHLTVAKITNNVQGVEVEAVSTSAATEGNLFRYSDGLYIFNLATRGLTAGTWLLRADLHDGTSRTVKISLR